jgi:hypothetical protein
MGLGADLSRGGAGCDVSWHNAAAFDLSSHNQFHQSPVQMGLMGVGGAVPLQQGHGSKNCWMQGMQAGPGASATAAPTVSCHQLIDTPLAQFLTRKLQVCRHLSLVFHL